MARASGVLAGLLGIASGTAYVAWVLLGQPDWAITAWNLLILPVAVYLGVRLWPRGPMARDSQLVGTVIGDTSLRVEACLNPHPNPCLELPSVNRRLRLKPGSYPAARSEIPVHIEPDFAIVCGRHATPIRTMLGLIAPTYTVLLPPDHFGRARLLVDDIAVGIGPRGRRVLKRLMS
jgi:hypothetical protein